MRRMGRSAWPMGASRRAGRRRGTASRRCSSSGGNGARATPGAAGETQGSVPRRAGPGIGVGDVCATQPGTGGPAVEAVQAVQADGLPRYGNLSSWPGVLRCTDYFGTVVFAASGAVTASSIGMDALGATIVGTITAIGGGTFRDAVILHKQPFWVEEYEYLLLASGVALGAFLAWPLLPEGNPIKAVGGGEGEAMWVGDAVGVGAFACIGAQNALRLGVHPAVGTVCGMVTATFGGLTRDTLCGLPNEKQGNGRILHSVSDIYASTALLGAASYIGMRKLNASYGARVAAGMGTAVAARIAAREGNLGLPTWNKPTFRTEK